MERDPNCLGVLQQTYKDICCVDDIFNWDAGQAFHACCTHQKLCALKPSGRASGQHSDSFHIKLCRHVRHILFPKFCHGREMAFKPVQGKRLLVAGAPCTPFSMRGKRKKTKDPVFRTHQQMYKQIRSEYDAALIENVPEYSVELARKRLPGTWKIQSCRIDPRRVFLEIIPRHPKTISIISNNT